MLTTGPIKKKMALAATATAAPFSWRFESAEAEADPTKSTNIKVNAADPGWVKTGMGSEAAPTTVREGGKTSLKLATLPTDGPTGSFLRMEQVFPWQPGA